MDREKVIKEYEDYVNSYISLTTGHDYEFEMHKAVLALLKEQEDQIKNHDESLEKARGEIKWLRGMLKEQETIEGTIEETRSEWPDETLPVSRNKEREYPCDHSRRNKA